MTEGNGAGIAPALRRRRYAQRFMVGGVAVALALTGGLVYLFAQTSSAPPTLPFDLEWGPLIQGGRGMADLEAFDAVTMAAVDLNGDGVLEILAHNDNGRFYVWSGKDGSLVAEIETNHPHPWDARELAGAAVGDLNGNDLTDIVLTNSAGWVTAFEAHPDGESIRFEKLWEVRLDPHEQDPDYMNNMYYGEWNGHPGLDGPAFLADTNGDGRDEIFVQLDDMPGLYKLEPDGSVAWWGNFTDGNSGPRAADLTGDGKIEVFFPSDGGQIHIYNAEHMGHRCRFSAPAQRDIWPGSISTAPAMGDITGDGRKEIIFGVRNITMDREDPDWIHRSHAAHFAIDADCNIIWKQSWDWNNPHVHMTPALVDLNDDGILDVIFQDWNTVGHKPGNWESTGKANLYALDGPTGEIIWKRPTETYWSNKNIAIADVTGTGPPSILVNEDRDSQDGIGLYRLSGSRQGFIPAPEGWSVTRGPLVADLDGDGRLDILLPIHRSASGCPRDLDVGCREGAIQIYYTNSTAEPNWSNNHPLNANAT